MYGTGRCRVKVGPLTLAEIIINGLKERGFIHEGVGNDVNISFEQQGRRKKQISIRPNVVIAEFTVIEKDIEVEDVLAVDEDLMSP